jgi:hypothetical protein
MELVEVEITGQAITARYGTLNTGDILRTDAEFAKHLVEDCAAAKYTTAKPVKQAIAPAAPVARKRKASVAAAPAQAAQGEAEPAADTSMGDASQSTAEDQGTDEPVVESAAGAVVAPE